MIPKCDHPEHYPYYCHALREWSDSWAQVRLYGRHSLTQLPQLPGLYGLVVISKLDQPVWLYIGESWNIRGRWTGTHQKWGVAELLIALDLTVYIAYWSLPSFGSLDQLKCQLKRIELDLIEAREPLLNRSLLPMDKSEILTTLNLNTSIDAFRRDT
jgi:hypothetical protein